MAATPKCLLKSEPSKLNINRCEPGILFISLPIGTFIKLNGDVPRFPAYDVYISQLFRFARVCSNVDDFNNINLYLTAK